MKMTTTTKPVTVDVLARINAVPSMLTWFDTILKHWHREAGSKPTAQMLMVALLLGKRPGVEALHVAMTLRAEGCTVQQFCLAGSCGPANNMRRDLVKSGWFSSTVEGKPYAYKLSVTAKGEAKLAKAQAQLEAAATVAEADKPAKGKAKKAKRKAKAKVTEGNTVTVDSGANSEPAPAETPISDAPSATEAVLGNSGVAEAQA
jgi:hypothetical protein